MRTITSIFAMTACLAGIAVSRPARAADEPLPIIDPSMITDPLTGVSQQKRDEGLVAALKADIADLSKTDPQAALTKCQKFFDEHPDMHSTVQADLVLTVANLYYPALKDPKNALATYDWLLKKFPKYPLHSVVRARADLLAQCVRTPPAAGGTRHKLSKADSQKSEYKYVTGNPGDSATSYPAPSGEEDCELLPQSWLYVTGWNCATQTSTGGAVGYPELNHMYSPNGTWWFSQVVGNDASSAGTHFADMKNTSSDSDFVYNYFDPSEEGWHDMAIGVNRLYGAAFDIVLPNAGVKGNWDNSAQAAPMQAYKNYVVNLRSNGIVCWHRWNGEPGSIENEIPCIDPAVPFMKQALQTQIDNPNYGYMEGGTGAQGGYQPDFGYNAAGTLDLTYWQPWWDAVTNHETGANAIPASGGNLRYNLVPLGDATKPPAFQHQ